MKTCGQCKHRWMECCLSDKRERLTVDADQEACESFELHLGTFDEAFEASLAKACKKHPDFVAIPAGKRAHAIGTAAGNMAHKLKAYLAGESTPMCHEDYQLEVALKSEVYEFLEAFHNGDFNAALAEAGDVVAVLYRALNGEGRTGDTGDSGCAPAGDGEEVGP